jgi:hypothetical protein
MATITVDFVVPNVNELIEQNLFDQLKVYRSPDNTTGSFVEITTVGTRPVLEKDKTSYTFVDTAGASSDYYASTFFNSTTLSESSMSEATQGSGDPAFDVITIEELKQDYLFGIDLSDDQGVPFPDSMFERYIRAAVGYIERRLDIRLTPNIIDDERHDFYRQDYYKYIRLQLHEFPLISVESIKLVLPTDQEVIDFDPSWFQIQDFSGQAEIVPGRGQLSVIVLGQTGAWLPLIYGWTDYIPDVFRIKYTAGFTKGKIPPELTHLVGMAASIGPLNVAGDLVVGAGIAQESINIDGISTMVSTTQSATASGYSARILQYRRELKEGIAELRRYYKGARMVVG